MCHCAENRALLAAAALGRVAVGVAVAQVGANMAGDVGALARGAAAKLAAARARLRR